MRDSKRAVSSQNISLPNLFKNNLNCKKTAIFLKMYLKRESRATWLTTLQPALKKWLTSIRRGKGMDTEQSFLGTKSYLHRFGLSTPVEERRMVGILPIVQRGYKKSTHQNREEYPLGLFSPTSRLHRSGIISTVEEKRIIYSLGTLKNEKRGSKNKREKNRKRVRLPLSLFLA